MKLAGKSPFAAHTVANTLIILTIALMLLLTGIVPVSAGGLPAPAADTTGLPALPRTLWSDTTEPANPNFQDVGGPIQLGVRFTSTDDGYVTGIRFFKGSQNTGAHTGQLYDLAGNLLASALFTNETAAGWQTVYFSAPVFITAGQTYVASYHTSSGFYARTANYFTSARVNLPLTAPADDGGANINGVYAYSATPAYPDQAYEQSNYWVDVVFETPAMPAPGTLSVYVGTRVTYRFPTAMNPATINTTTFVVRNPANEIVPATVTYDSAARQAVLIPASQFNNQTTYTVTILGGAGGVLDSLGNPLPGDITWNFTTQAGYADSGPGGPILVIGSTYDGFSRYYPEILRAEGLNAFRFTDISRVSASTLNNYDVVILGHMTLSDAQAAMFTNWVTNGGNLIAMRPDPRLASLLGITPAGSPPLSEGYLLVNGSGPGAGIVNQTIQYHGAADRYTLSGASNLATLYADAFTPTASPAVTMIDVGIDGGQAAMFAYDLARSVVLTRQGNPRWSGDDRDGIIPTRSADLFYGNKLGDPQPDWVNLDKVAIPQADEQQRLLANMILSMNLDKKPLPRFWYFPRDEKAVVVMTSDDHADNVVYDSLYDDRLDQLNSYDPPGCSVEDWECVRQSIYLVVDFVTTPTENAKIQAYAAQGHEFGVHINTNCADYTNAALDAFFSSGMSWFNSMFSFLPAPQTERTHCVAWSNYVEHIKVRRSHGIRLDTNFYYHPASWVNNRPGLFTGSGLMMKFADLDGSLIDVYQAVTHMTDEAGQTYPYTIDTLLDNALGPTGYYGAFVTNIHSDSGAFSDANIDIIESSLARGVPIITAQQMLTWLDGRNGSSFSAFDWQNDILSFRVNAAAGSRGLRGMLPVNGPNHVLTAITRNGVQIAYRTEVIKGVEYAFFDVPSGDYQAFYAPDTTPPVITNIQATINGDGTVTITWDTNEFSDSRVDYGTNPLTLTSSAQDAALTLAHAITLTGLTPNTTYYYRVTSADAFGNSATEPPAPNLPLSFTTPYNPFTDTTVIDFETGTLASCYVGAADNGELLLGPTLGEEFSGTGLPAGWTPYAWAGHSPVVAAGRLTLDDAAVYSNALFGPGHSLEFTATFGADDYQLAGFVGNAAWNEYWAAFGTVGSTDQVYITLSGGTNVPIGALVGAPHRYRIDRVGDVFTFYVDGVQVGSPAGYTPPGVGSVRIGVIDDEYDGDPLRVDWVRVAPYATPCVFTSRIFDAGLPADWLLLTWLGTTPTDTTATFETRTGNTPLPDGSWSAWEAVSGTDMVSPDGRYAQYRATLTTTTPFFFTPIVESVNLTYSAINQPPTVAIDQFIIQPDPTNASPIRFTVVFSEPVSGFDGSDILLSGTASATTAVVTGSGAAYVVEVSGMVNDGTVIAQIPADAAQDSGGLGNLASTSTDNQVTYDTTAPTVTVEQAAGQPDPANAAPILFTVTFSEPVSGFTASDVVLSGTAGAATVNIIGSGPVYTLEVSGMTGDGTVIAEIPAGAAQDSAGNGNTASTSTDNEVTYDATAPTVTVEQALGQPDPTNAAPILFTVTFSEPVSGFTASDVVLSGAAGATTVNITGSGPVYTLEVSGMANDGTVIAAVPANAAQDSAGNGNAASTSADNEVTYDATGATVTVEQAAGQPDPTNAAPILFTVTFNEPVTGFDASDVTLSGTAGAATVVITGAGPVYTLEVSGMTTSGTVIAEIPADAAQDAAGNLSQASTSADNEVTYDADTPTVTVEQALSQPDPANAAPILFTVTFSEPVSGFTASDVVLSGTAGAATVNIIGSGPVYTLEVNGMTGDGTVIAEIPAGAAQDSAGNGNAASTSADNEVTYDATAPTVTIEQALGQPDPTNAAPILFTVTFSEPVSGFTAADVTLSGTAGAATVNVTGTGAVYTLEVSGMTGNGTVSASVPANAAQDAAGNGNTASTSTDNEVTYDTTAPTVTIEQALGQPDPTNAAPILFTVTFSEPVSGFTAADVTLSGTAGAATVNVTGTGAVYTLAVSGMTGNGTVSASVPANAAQDAAGNGNAASTSADNEVTYDALGPTVTMNQAAGQADPTNLSPINFTVVFSEPVTGFDASDVQLSGTAGATTAVVTGSGAVYNVAVSGMANDGTVIASIPFGAAQDASANDSLASTSTDNTVTYDTTPPIVTIGAPSLAITNSGPVAFPVTVSGANTVNLTAGDVTLNVTGTANGTVTVSDGASAAPTITVSGISGNGTLGISIATGIASDSAGNSSAAAGPSSTFIVDNLAPTVVSITRADPSPTNAASVDFDVTLSEPVGGLSAANFSLPAIGVTGASITAISGSGANYTVSVNTGASDGTLGLNLVNSAGLTDPAGNPMSSLPFVGETYVIEKLNPQVLAIARADPNPTTATSVTFTITFSKPVTGVSDANFSLVATGVSGAALVSVTGSGASYTAVVSTGTGEGTVGLNLTDAGSIADTIGNPLIGVPFTGEFYTIDLTPPTVLANGIGSLPDSGDGAITELEIVTVNITQLLVRFSEGVSDPAGDAGLNDVTNPANYLLVQDNGDGIQTDSCSAGVTGGDLPALINAVTYDDTTFTATLNLNGGGGLSNGVYRLIVCGTTSITDLAGNRLAGDGTNARTDFTRNFIMAARNVGGGGQDDSQPINLSGVLIPATGFEPGILTDLPAQPASKMYAAYSGLTLEIPRLGVKVDIVGVPFTENGWDVTWLYKQAGYLNGSAFPTTAGNAVITAHVWDALNRPGPFYGLKDLVYGDKIIIHAWGKVFTYEVQSNARLSPRSIAQVMKRETQSWLTLVTCETFDAEKSNYLYRRMVRAVLVSVTVSP